MPFAHRMSSKDELLLTTKIHDDIKDLKGKKSINKIAYTRRFF